MTLLTWIILGLIAGGLASLLVPGRTPGGVVGAILIGILGAVVGGWLAEVFTGGSSVNGINLYSVLVAVLGSVILLAVARMLRTS
jgi:uncharacterized membrane protein YeaQ/YmgE (transglycosylase-associated protein family)